MNILIVLEPPKGKKWRKVLSRFGEVMGPGMLFSHDQGLVKTASFVIERMGGKTLVLVEGAKLSTIVLEIFNPGVLHRDILIRCVKEFCLPIPRFVGPQYAIALFPRASLARKFVETNKLAIPRCGKLVSICDVDPLRKVDADRLLRVARFFIHGWGKKVLDKARIGPEEYVNLWESSLQS